MVFRCTGPTPNLGVFGCKKCDFAILKGQTVNGTDEFNAQLQGLGTQIVLDEKYNTNLIVSLFKFAFLNNMVFMVLIKLTFLETTICLCYKDNFL